METGVIRRLHWVDTRDMLADGLTKGGIDRELLHNVSNNCSFKSKHEAFTHSKSIPPVAGSSITNSSKEEPVGGLESPRAVGVEPGNE